MNLRFLFLAFSVFSLHSVFSQNYFSSTSCDFIIRGAENNFTLENEIDTNTMIIETIDCSVKILNKETLIIEAGSNKEATICIRVKSTNTLLEKKIVNVYNRPVPTVFVDYAEEGSQFLIKKGVISVKSVQQLMPCFNPSYPVLNYEIKIEGLEKIFSGEGNTISHEQIMELVRHKSSYGKDKTLKVDLVVSINSPEGIIRIRKVEFNY